MSFFTDAERNSLQISAMILHVVGGEDFTPEIALAIEHAEFFIARIRDTDVSAVYQFKDKSAVRDELERIARDETQFESGSQNIAREFSRLHGGTARDGAFFVFELATDEADTRIYSLVKYDYRDAIERSDDADGQQHLRRIVHAFIDDKKAIQKSALIRVVNGQSEIHVSVHDRTKRGADIADYFATFLDIARKRSDEELNRALVEVLRKTLQKSKGCLPNKNVAGALRHAKDVLRHRQMVDEDSVVEAILAAAGNPEKEESRKLLKRRTSQNFRTEKLSGLAFPPDQKVLHKPPLRRLRTTEGVTMTYPDEANGTTVRRQAASDEDGEVITITTSRVVEDTIVPNHSR